MKNKILTMAVIITMAALTIVMIPSNESDADTGGTFTVGENTFNSLSESIDNLGSNDKIVMNGNVTLDSVVVVDNQSFTLNLNGFTLTGPTAENNEGTILDIKGDSSIYITGNGALVNQSFGSAGTSKNLNDASCIIDVRANSTLVLENVKVDAMGYGVGVWTDGELQIKNANIIAGTSAVAGNGTNSNATISIFNGYFESENSAAVFFPSSGELTVTGGEFVGKTGFDLRGGTCSIDNCSIKTSGSIDTNKEENDGPVAWGFGIVAFNMPGYGNNDENISLTIGDNVTINTSDISSDLYVGGYPEFEGDDRSFSAPVTYDPSHDMIINTPQVKFTVDKDSAYLSGNLNADFKNGTLQLKSEMRVLGSNTLEVKEGQTFDLSNCRLAFALGEIYSNGNVIASPTDATTFINSNTGLSIFSQSGNFGNNHSAKLTLDGDIVLEKTVTLSFVGTMDLNGHIISCSANTPIATNTQTLIDTGEEKGKIEYTGSANNVAALNILGTAILDGICVESTAYGIATTFDNANVSISNVDVKAVGPALASNGTLSGTSMKIDSGNYISTGSVAVYIPNGDFDLSGGTFTGLSGLQVCGGSLSVSGDIEVNATGVEEEKKENDGPVVDGAALSVINRNGAYHIEHITVNGGKFNSSSGVAAKAYSLDGTTISDWNTPAESTITIMNGNFQGDVSKDLLGEGLEIGDNGDVVGKEGVVFDVTSDQFLDNAEYNDRTVTFELTRDYRITGNHIVYFENLDVKDYDSIIINGNGHTIYGELWFDSTFQSEESANYSVSIQGLTLDGSVFGTGNVYDGEDANNGYGIVIMNQRPAVDDPRIVDFSITDSEIRNYGSKGIYIHTVSDVLISDVLIENCAFTPHWQTWGEDPESDSLKYYDRGDYAVDIDVTGVECNSITIRDVTFKGTSGSLAALKIAQRGGAGDDPNVWGDATILGVTMDGLDFSDSSAPRDIVLGSEPNITGDNQEELRDYNSAFPIDLTAYGETSLSIWGSDRHGDENLSLALSDGSRVRSTGNTDENRESGRISIELISGTARVSGVLGPNMSFTADESAVTFASDFVDRSGGGLNIHESEAPPYNPGWNDDDDYVPLPPVIYEEPERDNTTEIVACAAAAVVAALMAAFLILERRRN